MSKPMPRRFEWQQWGIGCLCIALLLLPSGHVAQPAWSAASPRKKPLFPAEAAQALAAAAAAAALHQPTGALGVLLAGQSLNIWEAPATPAHEKATASSDKAPVIDPDLLAGVEDRAKVQSAAENYDEAWAYNYLLVLAHATPAAAFARSARRELTFAHLFEEPSKYRGQVVHIEGRLKRLRRFDAPRMAAKQGVPVLYEGWIFGDAYGSNPYCVITTAVPDSIPLGETLNHPVAFDGYFFKRYRYKAGDGWRDAPLLIGHALCERANSPAETDASVASLLLPGLIAIVAATVLLVIGLNWWFRRSERRVRTYLDKTRKANLVEPGPDSPESVP